MTRSLLSLVLALHLLPVHAQQEAHPIEQEMSRCTERNSSTLGMLDCAMTAYERWDAELNAVYQELMANLPSAAADQLRDSQRHWLAFRDAEFEAIGEIYGNQQGSMWPLIMAGARLDLLQQRVETLIEYRDMLFPDQ